MIENEGLPDQTYHSWTYVSRACADWGRFLSLNPASGCMQCDGSERVQRWPVGGGPERSVRHGPGTAAGR
jgi:hypothetical protein